MAAARPSNLAENFKPNDLLYGLEEQRALLRVALERIVNPDAKVVGQAGKIPVTVDKMNDLVLIVKDPKRKEKATSWARDGKGDRPEGIAPEIATASLRRHFDIQSKAPKKVNLARADLPPNRKKLTDEARFIRRACKAAMSGNQVHFILEGLQPRHIFDELYSLENPAKGGEGRQCFYDSHTSAELRYIVTNIKNLKIKFYRISKNVAAEIEAAVKAAGEDADADADGIEYTYLRSGKAYVEVDIYEWLARKDLAHQQRFPRVAAAAAAMAAPAAAGTADTKVSPEAGPAMAWLGKKVSNKKITPTFPAKVRQAIRELRATFVASPGEANHDVTHIKDELSDLPEDFDDVPPFQAPPATVVGSVAAEVVAAAAAAHPVSSPKKIKTDTAKDVTLSPTLRSVSPNSFFHHNHQTKADQPTPVMGQGAVAAAAAIAKKA